MRIVKANIGTFLLVLLLAATVGIASYFGSVKLRDQNGDPYGVREVDNKIRVSSMPYTYDIAEGNIAGHTALRKFGHNSDVAATYEDVWDGSSVYWYLPTAQTLVVASDDAGDTSGSTGAGEFELEGLDSDWAFQTETIVLQGATTVATANSYIRVYRAKVTEAGTSGANEGTITISDNTNTTAVLQILPGENQTLMALFPVPANTTAYLTHFYAATDVANKSTEIELRVRQYGSVFQVKHKININQGLSVYKYDFPLPIPAKSDIAVWASASAGGGNVSAGFDLWYEE